MKGEINRLTLCRGFTGNFDAPCSSFSFSLHQEGLLLSKESGGGGNVPYHSQKRGRTEAFSGFHMLTSSTDK